MKHRPVLGAVSAVVAMTLAAESASFADNGNGSHRSTPDFGPNVVIFDPSMSVATINAKLQSLTNLSTGFDTVRNAVFFMPGTYGSAAGADTPATASGFIDGPVGFMETVQGLGSSPDDVVINGNLRAGTATANALGTFWRSLSNVKINPIEGDETAHTLRWNTSQAAPVRRVDIAGNLDLAGGVAGGNIVANSRISGTVSAGLEWVTDPTKVAGQFYYFLHDSQIGSFQGHYANFVFSGVLGAPPQQFDPGDVTAYRNTPLSREQPFLYVNNGSYEVFVPDVRPNSSGYHWGAVTHQGGNNGWNNPGARQYVNDCYGNSLPIRQFYIAKPTDTVATLNDELRRGKNLILTPGVYSVTEPLHVTQANTIIMGLGMATVTPTAGTAAIEVDNVPGVSISAITVDANTVNSPVLIQVGTPASGGRRSALGNFNPTLLSDVFVRVGGSYAGNATTSFEVNQDNALIDDIWAWRADHGNTGTTGWTVNTGAHGLVVNGDNVLALGLFVEHYQQAQMVWNGDGGQTIFLESEAPYDPPSQAAYMNGTQDGYPFYQVGENVRTHQVAGISTSTLFIELKVPIYVHSAFQVPETRGVQIHDELGQVILGLGGIQNLVNEDGISALAGGASFISGVTATTQLTASP